MAAYNMGYGGLLAAIRKYDTNDYWELARFESGLPWETTLYVPKIIAGSIVARNMSAFGFGDLQLEAPVHGEEIHVAAGTALASGQAAVARLSVKRVIKPITTITTAATAATMPTRRSRAGGT